MLKTPIRSTIDTEQLKMFSVMMNTWWDPQGPMKGLHTLNELRVPFIIGGLEIKNTDESAYSRQNLKLLDVGCGGGILCEEHAIKNVNLYDGVIASEVIEHVNNQEMFVKSCIQALKPGGRVFFTTPSKTRLSQFLVIWFAENIIGCPPKGTHQYEKFISVEDLSLLLAKYGCQIERTRGCFFNMLMCNWCWTENQMFFYAFQAIKK